MHELSIAAALVEEAGVHLEPGARAVSLTVRVGGLSGVDPEALRLAFPVASEGSPFADTQLVIETVPALVVCRACGAETRSGLPLAVCEQCGSTDTDIRAGRELLIQSMEIETETPEHDA